MAAGRWRFPRALRWAAWVTVASVVLATGVLALRAVDDRFYQWTIGNLTALGPRTVFEYWQWGRRVYAAQARLLQDCGFCVNDSAGAVAFVLDRYHREIDTISDGLRADPADREARARLAGLLLQLGRYDDAIREYEVLLARQPDDAESAFLMAAAHLRAGRYDRAGVILRSPAASHAGAAARWLLHVAQHALGDERADAFDLAPSARRPAPLQFVDVAPAAGVTKISANKAVAVGDFDGDGRLDILTGGSFGPISFFRNNGDGTFTDVAPGALLGRMTDVFEIVPADYDNDGHLDLYLTRGGPVKTAITTLLRNRGDGTFEDASDVAGVRISGVSTFTAAWGDFDNDGHVDLYVTTVATRPAPGLGVPVFKSRRNALFRNNGDGTFTDVARAAGVDSGYSSYGASWGDYDGDGCLDLYVSTLMGPNHLYRNNCDGTFADVAKAAGVDMPWTAFVSWFWDFDNDGKLDLFSTNYALSEHVLDGMRRGAGPAHLTMRLYRNNGDGTFTDVTGRAGLRQPWGTMGGNFGDLDGDGHLDFCLGNGGPDMQRLEPNARYRNNGDGTFAPLHFGSGLLRLGKGHGIAFGNVFGDGLPTMYLALGGQWPGDLWASALFRPVGVRPRWITVRPRGVASNRAALGVQIRVRSGDLVQFREVGPGSGFGASALEQWFGLGPRDRIDELVVFWPRSRTRQVFRDLPVNVIVDVTEFESTYRIVPPRPTPPLSPSGPDNPWRVRLEPDEALHRIGGRVRIDHVPARAAAATRGERHARTGTR